MKRCNLVLIAGGLLVFFVAYFSINTDAVSDPKLTLVVSQALVETGAPFLDPYANDDLLGKPFAEYLSNGDIQAANGRYFNYFPLGPSLLSVPFVAVARGLGYDMRTADNFALQRLLSAVTVALVFFLAHALAIAYIDCRPALILAFVAVLGSSLLSTLGTALWSHNYAVLLAGAALLLLVRESQGKSSSLRPALLGLLLFLCFVNRPSMVAFIAPVLAYVLWRDRRAMVITALVSGTLLAVYLAWNASATGSILPIYFSTARLQAARTPLWVGVVGNLVSPSRGLLIFSPFLLPVLVGYVVYWRSLLRLPIVWLCLVWIGLHLLIVARAASWWGGWSFGPRLLTDIWPGLIVLTAILWAFLLVRGNAGPRRAFEYGFLALGAIAIVLHVIQGLNSQPASRWNSYITPVPPPASGTLGDLFNWRYAQPVATNTMLCDIERAAIAPYTGEGTLLSRYAPGRTYLAADGLTRWELPLSAAPGPVPDAAAARADAARVFLPLVADPSYDAFYWGWSKLDSLPADQVGRWSQCREAEIWLNLSVDSSADTLMLAVTGLTNDAQEVGIAVNGQQVGVMNWSGQLETQTITFPTALLDSDGWTRLTFAFPSAHYPNRFDQRPLGLALVAFTLTEPGGDGLLQPAPTETPAAYPP